MVKGLGTSIYLWSIVFDLNINVTFGVNINIYLRTGLYLLRFREGICNHHQACKSPIKCG